MEQVISEGRVKHQNQYFLVKIFMKKESPVLQGRGVNRHTDASEDITFPHPSDADSNHGSRCPPKTLKKTQRNQ